MNQEKRKDVLVGTSLYQQHTINQRKAQALGYFLLGMLYGAICLEVMLIPLAMLREVL